MFGYFLRRALGVQGLYRKARIARWILSSGSRSRGGSGQPRIGYAGFKPGKNWPGGKGLPWLYLPQPDGGQAAIHAHALRCACRSLGCRCEPPPTVDGAVLWIRGGGKGIHARRAARLLSWRRNPADRHWMEAILALHPESDADRASPPPGTLWETDHPDGVWHWRIWRGEQVVGHSGYFPVRPASVLDAQVRVRSDDGTERIHPIQSLRQWRAGKNSTVHVCLTVGPPLQEEDEP